MTLEDPDIIQQSAWLDSDWCEASAEEAAPSISQGDRREEDMRRRINAMPGLRISPEKQSFFGGMTLSPKTHQRENWEEGYITEIVCIDRQLGGSLQALPRYWSRALLLSCACYLAFST